VVVDVALILGDQIVLIQCRIVTLIQVGIIAKVDHPMAHGTVEEAAEIFRIKEDDHILPGQHATIEKQKEKKTFYLCSKLRHKTDFQNYLTNSSVSEVRFLYI
jgi:hypothetical protein